MTLSFHRVLDDQSYQKTNSLPGIVIRDRTFQELLQYLGGRYEPVALSDVVPGTTSGKMRVAITFDDGWRDNYTTALPVVKASRMPITIFVCPAVLGQEMPFWPERAMALLRATKPGADPEQLAKEIEALKQVAPEKRERYFADLDEQASERHALVETHSIDRTLSWDEVTEMDKAGVRFGSHTDTHQILTAGSAHLAREEVRLSKEVLELNLAKPCEIFAYPNGNWSPETRQIVEEIGFTRAVTTQRGTWTSASDSLAIPRSNVTESNVVGLTGHFWPAMFRYTALWKAWCATARVPKAVATSEQSVASTASTRVDSAALR